MKKDSTYLQNMEEEERLKRENSEFKPVNLHLKTWPCIISSSCKEAGKYIYLRSGYNENVWLLQNAQRSTYHSK